MILGHLDEIARADADADAVKHALVAHGGFDHRKLFPQYFPCKVTDATPENASEGTAYDYSEITWKTPTDAMDEFNRVMAALQKSSSGVVSGEQLSSRTWSDWQ